jgi:hypothetical protein
MTSDMESSMDMSGRESAQQLLERSSTDYDGADFLEAATAAGEI